MTRSARDMDKALKYAREAGFTVHPWGADSWRVVHPKTGEQARVCAAPGNRRISKEKAKLRKLGAPASDAELATFLAVHAPKPPPAPPPAPEPPKPAPPNPAPAPDPVPVPEEKPVSTITATPGAPGEIAACAFVVWGSIREECANAEVQNLEGVQGVMWRGSFTNVVSGLWPELAKDNETRRKINVYLRSSENMLCLKRGNPSLWWLRTEWNDTSPVTRGAVEVRTTRRPEPRVTAGEPAPVTVRKTAPKPGPPAAPPPPAPVAGSDPVAALTALVDRARTLETENERLTAENASLRSQLAAVRSILKGT